jgi:sugar phosphate permease
MTGTSAPAVATPTAGDRFPGWRVVTASFCCLATTAGLGFYGLAAYLTVLSRERGWSVGSISAAGAIFFLVGGFAGLLAARQISRHDVRAVIVVGAVIGGVALFALGHVSEVWHVYVVYAVFSIGHSFAGLVPATTVVTRWFHAKRSVALAAASTGLSVGGMIITPFAKWLLDTYGLARTAPWLAGIWVIGIVPVTLTLMRPDPAALGWLPDGGRTTDATTIPPLESVSYGDAVRTRFFLFVSIGFLMIMTAQVGGIQQLVKLVEERVGSSTATLATTVLAGASVVARLAGGQIAAKRSLARLAITFGLVQGTALILIAFIDLRVPLLLAIALFGATVGNLLMLHPLLIGQEFGPRDYARIFSRSQFVAFVGTATGPYLLGTLRDTSGGYVVPYVVAGLLSISGALILPRRVRCGA